MRAFRVPRGRLEAKPPHGDPCTSCGLCCEATLCPLAMHVFRTSDQRGPCPALAYADDGTSRCGLVSNPMAFALVKTLEHGAQTMSAAALVLIGSGTGCDARFNGESANEAFYDYLRRWDRENDGKIKRSKRLWGQK